ncbi:MAG: helix-turn-helix domain-containing protein [Candidatus Kapaibacterium sp.]
MSVILDFATPHVLRNKSEYEAAVEEIDHLVSLSPAKGTEADDRLEFLAVLMKAYEDDHVDTGLDKGTPQELVDFMLDQKGMTRTDLYEILGGKSRVSEFFSGLRPLSISQIQSLRNALGIPADLLFR